MVARSVLAKALTRFLVAALLTVSAVSAPAKGELDHSQFHGVHWSRLGDNFTYDKLVLQGLSANDTYGTAKAKAGEMFDAFKDDLGANTARLPVNPATANTEWWDTYRGVIDAGTERGFRIILCYWTEDSTPKIPNMSTWNKMWDTVSGTYLSNPLVYFSPMNEPGYSTKEWLDIAAKWIVDRPAIPRNRLFIDGALGLQGGPANDVKAVCNDSRLDHTYLAMHRYGFAEDAKTYEQWVEDIKTNMGWDKSSGTFVGACDKRVVMEEFGAAADSGNDYHDPKGADKEIPFLRATTDTLRELGIGSIWCHVIGGRTTSPDHDTLNIKRLFSGNRNLPLWTPNISAVDRLHYAWGESGSPTRTVRNIGADHCLDATTDGDAATPQLTVRTCQSGANQMWTRTAAGQITINDRKMCLSAESGNTTEGTRVGVSACVTGLDSQKWTFYSDGTIRTHYSTRWCLDVDVPTSKVQLWSCWGGNNQKWNAT